MINDGKKHMLSAIPKKVETLVKVLGININPKP